MGEAIADSDSSDSDSDSDFGVSTAKFSFVSRSDESSTRDIKFFFKWLTQIQASKAMLGNKDKNQIKKEKSGGNDRTSNHRIEPKPWPVQKNKP